MRLNTIGSCIFVVVVALCVGIASVGCDGSSGEGAVDGSLLDTYDGSFDDVRIRLYSSELSVEYFRHNGEVPIRVIVNAKELQDGPGSYEIPEQGTVSGISQGTRMPTPSGGEIQLDEFRQAEGADVRGEFSARMDAGNTSVTLAGHFSGELEIVDDVFEPEDELLDVGFIDGDDVEYLPPPDVDVAVPEPPDISLPEPDADEPEPEDAGEPDADDELDAGEDDAGPGDLDAGEEDTGPGDLDAGEEDTGPGDLDAGEEDTGPGEEDAGTGEEDAGTGEEDAGTGEEDAGTGEEDAGTGEEDTGTGEEDAGTGEEDAGTGEEDAGTGEEDAGEGDAN